MQDRNNIPTTWEFPDLAKHHPNCSSIPDNQLKELIMGRWAIQDGVAKIPYTFTNTPYGMRNILFSIYYYFTYQKHPLTEIDIQSKDIIKGGLTNLQKISNGKIEFYENPNSNQFFPRGLYFSFIDEAWLQSFKAGALTFPRINNNGEMQSAFIFYPDTNAFKFKSLPEGSRYTNSWIAWALNAYHQEMIHGLGIEDVIQVPKIEKALAQIPDGVFCSVMPYVERITNPVTACIENCNPPYAVYPGALDETLLKLAYDENMHTCKIWDSNHFKMYLLNAMEGYFSSLGISFAHQFTISFTSNIALRPNKPILPEKIGFLIADASLLGLTIYLEMPVMSTLAFANTALIKYLPETTLNKLPKPLKSIVTSNVSVHILNFSQAYQQGRCFVPFLMTGVTSVLGSFCGSLLGAGAGKGAAWIANLIPQAIVARYESIVANDTSNTRNYGTFNVSRNVSSFFNSCANRMQGWLGRNETDFELQAFAPRSP